MCKGYSEYLAQVINHPMVKQFATAAKRARKESYKYYAVLMVVRDDKRKAVRFSHRQTHV